MTDTCCTKHWGQLARNDLHLEWNLFVSLRPTSSRCRLDWKVFSQEGSQSWKLVLPQYYASLFEGCLPALLKRTVAEFRASSTGKTQITTFHDLTEQDERRIQAFLTFYERAWCLSTNKYIEKNFSDELDFCLALDKIRPERGEAYTEVGQWEHDAKYSQDADALSRLADEMCRAIGMLPLSKIPPPRVLTFVPSNREKKFHMPGDLAGLVRNRMRETFWGTEAPLLIPTLTSSKQSAKNMTVAQKIAHWEKLVQAKAIQLSRPVKECSVIVVDDLYQSGVSIWSFAKYLKARQASMVVGLACVKSLRDTDNK